MTARCRGEDHHPDRIMAARSCRACFERLLVDHAYALGALGEIEATVLAALPGTSRTPSAHDALLDVLNAVRKGVRTDHEYVKQGSRP